MIKNLKEKKRGVVLAVKDCHKKIPLRHPAG
jgi:hypothetical protein